MCLAEQRWYPAIPLTWLALKRCKTALWLVWERPTIRALARRFKLLLENALLVALDHFDWYVSAYASLSSQPARERLARVLVNLAPSIGERVLGGVELHISDEELPVNAGLG